jgi:iron(III) transport system substrate-binding protein
MADTDDEYVSSKISEGVEMKYRKNMLGCVAIFVSCFFHPYGSSAGESAPSVHLEGAKKEGSLTWYATMNVTDAKKIVDAFEKKYPFLKVNLYRAGSARLLNRLASEYRAGSHIADVAETNILESYFFQKKGYFEPYRSTEAQFFPPQFKDPNGFWVANYLNFYIIAYNTRMVSPANAPRGYEDLLNPRWKNAIGLKDDSIRWYGALLEYMGAEKGKSFMRQLAAQKPSMFKGSYGLISELVAAGEVAMGVVLAATVESLKNDKKAPIDWESSVEPAATSIVGLHLLSKAPHPNAAKLFIDFFLSAETQNRLLEMNRVPARVDVKPKNTKLDPANLKVFVISPEMSERFERYNQEFREIFLGGR